MNHFVKKYLFSKTNHIATKQKNQIEKIMPTYQEIIFLLYFSTRAIWRNFNQIFVILNLLEYTLHLKIYEKYWDMSRGTFRGQFKNWAEKCFSHIFWIPKIEMKKSGFQILREKNSSTSFLNSTHQKTQTYKFSKIFKLVVGEYVVWWNDSLFPDKQFFHWIPPIINKNGLLLQDDWTHQRFSLKYFANLYVWVFLMRRIQKWGRWFFSLKIWNLHFFHFYFWNPKNVRKTFSAQFLNCAQKVPLDMFQHFS